MRQDLCRQGERNYDRVMEIRYFNTLESTNNYCKLLDPKSVGEFTVICARQQTAGIGQQGSVWAAEPYKNLTFSLILKPTFLAAEEQYRLTMAIALAIAESIDEVFSKFTTHNSTSIKWPNDIYVGDKKICGTLITNQISGSNLSQSICGIGLNVNQTKFPDWVPNPTSLKLLTGENYQLDTILNTILTNIEKEYTQLKHNDNNIEVQYVNRLYRLNVEAGYIYQNQTIRATITGINRFGHLQLNTADGEHINCALKEIKFVI